MKPKDDEKQRAIAEATFNLVAQTGLSGLTMADIARTAGIATSTLYVYYPSKDELISQLYEEAKTATMRWWCPYSRGCAGTRWGFRRPAAMRCWP